MRRRLRAAHGHGRPGRRHRQGRCLGIVRPAVVAVDASGKVRTQARGTATVTATTKDIAIQNSDEAIEKVVSDFDALSVAELKEKYGIAKGNQWKNPSMSARGASGSTWRRAGACAGSTCSRTSARCS